MRKFLLAMAAFLFLSGCGQSAPNHATDTLASSVTPSPVVSTQLPAEQPSNSNEACLPPLATFAFPHGETNITPPPQKPVLPPSEWNLVSPLPNFDKLASYRLALISYNDQYSEIWVLSNNRQGLFQYRTDTEEWSVNKTTYDSIASLLFLDKEGNVWSARAGYYGLSDTQPFLSRYDKGKGEFISVYNNVDTWTLTISSVKVDEKGIFWLMVKNRGSYQLLSFDPSVLEAKLHFESPDYGSSLEISRDNKILFVDSKENDLIAYTPDTDKIDTYHIPVAFGYADLYLDSFERLWFNDVGWFDFSTSTSRQWFTVVRSPVFIGFPEGIGQWVWTRPTFSTESADGLLWFRSIRGTGWLDTKTGTWCLFTTYDSNIIQDSEHNLWMLADGKLFELILKK